MLVFGAVSFKSLNDGGIEVIHDGTHQWLSADDVYELSSWINSHMQSQYRIKGNRPTRQDYGGELNAMAAMPEPAQGF